MLKRHYQLFEALFMASDLFVVSLAWLLSYVLRFDTGLFPVEKGVPPFSDYLKMLIFVWPIWAFVYRRSGLYRPMRGVRRLRETWMVIQANSLGVLLLLALTYLFREKSVPFSRLVFLVFWFLTTYLSVFARMLVRDILRAMRKRGFNLRYVLIVGAGDLAAKVARRIMWHPEYGIELLGCLSKDPPGAPAPFRVLGAVAEEQPAEVGFKVAANGKSHAVAGQPLYLPATPQPSVASLLLPRKAKILGTYSDLPALLERGGIDQVIVALPLADHDQIETVISSIGDSIVDVRVVPDLHQFIQLGSLVEEFDGLPVVSLSSTPLSGINRVPKRMMDLILGTLFLVLLLPIMLLTAAAVKLTSRGSVFFSQERVGLDGKVFRIYKFRTMSLDAESDGAKFAVRGDPRVTAVGRILRKLNIDELPQLVNVIRGQMSLVGPRPERPVFIQEFRRHVPKYMLRHKVQAGMTGWAQVHGWRGNTSIEKRIQHDLYYIEHWSLALDLKILGLTLFRSFRDKNAY